MNDSSKSFTRYSAANLLQRVSRLPGRILLHNVPKRQVSPAYAYVILILHVLFAALYFADVYLGNKNIPVIVVNSVRWVVYTIFAIACFYVLSRGWDIIDINSYFYLTTMTLAFIIAFVLMISTISEFRKQPKEERKSRLFSLILSILNTVLQGSVAVYLVIQLIMGNLHSKSDVNLFFIIACAIITVLSSSWTIIDRAYKIRND